jgi:hypothetical protein
MILPVLGISAWLFFVVRNVLINRRARAWPLAVARVETFEVKQVNRRFFRTILYYSYSAHGHFYSGEFVRTQSSWDRADSLGSDWQDRQIMVHYNPVDPSQSVFVEQDDLNTVD